MKRTKADKGWAWVVLPAAFGIHIVIGALTYSAGIIQVLLLERFHESNTKTSLTGSLFIFFESSGGLMASIIVRRLGCKVAVITGSLLTTSGYVCSVYAPSINWMYVTYGTMAGLGCGITYNAAIICIVLNFVKYRNLACGISLTGVGLGSIFFPMVIETAREAYGTELFFYVPAALGVQQLVFGFLMFPSDIEIQQRFSTVDSKSHNEQQSTPAYFLKLLRTPSIVCMSVGLFLGHFSVYLIFIHFPSYAISVGSTPLQASSLLSIAGLCGMFSRVLTGFAANDDSVDEILVLNGSYGILGLATCLLPLYGLTFSGQIVYAVILGTYYGTCYVVMASLSIQLVGIEYVTPAVGLEMTISAFGSVSGAPVAGAILEAGGTYRHCFIMSGFMLLLATVIGMSAALFKPELQKKKGVDGDIEITLEAFLKPDDKTNITSNEAYVIKENVKEMKFKDEKRDRESAKEKGSETL